MSPNIPTISPELEHLPDNLRKSADLIENPISPEMEQYDSIFVLAKVTEPGPNKWLIDIGADDPTVVMDEKKREKWGLEGLSTVPEIRENGSELSLVSGGAVVILIDNDGNESLALLKRDSGARVDPNCWTTPAGRCGEPLSKTGRDETNQEIIMIDDSDDGDEIQLLAFYDNDSQKDEIIQQKIEQVKLRIEDLQSKFAETGDDKYRKQVDALLRFKGAENVKLIKIDDVSDPRQELDTIDMQVNGKVVDTVQGMAYMDEENNTLEIRRVLKVVLPEGVSVSTVIDGEKFDRDVALVKIEDLDKLEGDFVPFLNYYYQRRKFGVQVAKQLFGIPN